MSDEVSLFALMDSHLSKTRIENGRNPVRSTSDMLLPSPSGPQLVIPNFFPGSSPMKDFLAEQISNTFKAKEKRQQEEEEQRKIEEEMKILKIREKQQLSAAESLENLNSNDQEYVIDLIPAIIQQPKPNPNKTLPVVSDEVLPKGPKLKPALAKLLTELPLRWDKETCLYKPWDPNLPCTTDMSFILKQKIKRGKCSSFGKVLCSRVRSSRQVTGPYEVDKLESKIARFDFRTKSPGDIFKENQRKPKMSTRWTVDILDFM